MLRSAITVILAFTLFSTASADEGSFSPCMDADDAPALAGTQCALIPAPLDPAGGDLLDEEVNLFVRKFPASGETRGDLWVIAGGPGESGASLYSFIDQIQTDLPGLDIFVPDHRGTGFSTRLCPEEENPESVGGAALAGAEWGSCYQYINVNAERSRAFSVDNAANDLAVLLKATASERPVYVYGVSYGTQLVLRLMANHSLKLGGVILDSLTPLQDDERFDLSRRSLLVDNVGRAVLARCDADKACHERMGAPADEVYAQVLANAAQEPEWLAEVPGGNLKHFMGALLDFPELRKFIPTVITGLMANDTAPLNAVKVRLNEIALAFGAYPQSPASIPLVSIISRSENDLRPDMTKAELAEEESKLLFTSPLPGYLIDPGVPEYQTQGASVSESRRRAFPIIVVHGTLDPKTAYDGAVDHVSVLRQNGRVSLVTVADAPHFILMTAPECFSEAARSLTTGRNMRDRTCRADADEGLF
ncbi:MAG: alpha/beta fold hydrolase [Parvularculaceae bacterium]